MSVIHELIELVTKSHFPNQPATTAEIERVQVRLGVFLPLDMRLFFSSMNGACLFDKTFSPYRLMACDKLANVSTVILGTHAGPSYAKSWIAFCDVQDGNYVAIDVSSESVFDCFHETFGDGQEKIIARSFSEFLREALASGGREFWLSST